MGHSTYCFCYLKVLDQQSVIEGGLRQAFDAWPEGIHFGFALAADLQRLQGADLQGQYLADGLAGHAQFMGHMQCLAVPVYLVPSMSQPRAW